MGCKIRVKKRRYCLADLDKLITIQARAIQPPQQDSPDYTEAVQDQITVYASIKTVSGESIFDGTNTEVDVTHHFVIQYLGGLTFENWVEYADIKYRILEVENIDERNEFYIIRATKRGANTLNANFA